MRGVTVNGAKLLAVRLNTGLTQDDLARQARVDSKTIRKAEQGKRLDLTSLTRVAYALKTDLHQLIIPGDDETGQHVTWRDVFLEYKRAFDANDIERLLALYHEEAVLYLPGSTDLPFGGASRGKEAIRQTTLAAWSTVRQDPTPIEDLTFLESDNGLAFRGNRRFYSPSGKPFYIHALQMMTFRDNLILDHHIEFDTLDFAKQFEMLP